MRCPRGRGKAISGAAAGAATGMLKDGQLVRVNGSNGTITVLAV